MMKVGSDITRTMQVAQVEQSQSQSAPVTNSGAQSQEISHVAQDAQFAQAKKSEQAMFTSLQKSMLGAELLKTGIMQSPVAPRPPVGIGSSTEKIGDTGGPSEVLGPGSPPAKVHEFQVELNEWRAANGLPAIQTSGVYSPETELAVKDFQSATGLKSDGSAGGNTKARLALENNPAFRQLNGTVQGEIRQTMNKYQDNPAARDNLLNLATSDNFAYFNSTDSQLWALFALKKAPGDSTNAQLVNDTVRDMAIVENKDSFRQLPSSTQKQIHEAMYEHTKFPTGRTGLSQLVTSLQFSKLTPEQQEKVVTSLRDNPSDTAPSHYNNILNSPAYWDMEDVFRNQVINVMTQNAGHPEALEAMDLLMHDPSFISAPPSDQIAQLNAFRRTDPNLIL